MSTPENTQIATKIRKLLAQAADQAGTPEGDAFADRVFELITKYGMDEAEIRAEAAKQGHSSEAERHLFAMEGRYQDMQVRLLSSLAAALHCQTILQKRYDSIERRNTMIIHVIGVENHVVRVRMLFAGLLPSMLKLAATARPDYPLADSGKLRVYRRSFMLGFVSEIGRRLREAELKATSHASSGAALVVQSDAEKAIAKMAELYGKTRKVKSTNRIHGGAFDQGQAEGAKANLGLQSGVAANGQRALG